MPDPLYTRLQSTANRLIAKYGKAAVITRNVESGPAYDPTVTPSDYNVTMVETGYQITERDNSIIQTGDKVGLISVDGEAVPQHGDQITIDGEVFKFVDLQPLNPGGVHILSEFVARR